MRNRHELGLMVAHAFHQETGQSVAVMGKFEANAPIFMAFATGRLYPATNTRTPVVNLYQSAAEQKISSSSRDVYCSYIPTTACLGILRMSNARAIFYIDNGQMRCIELGETRVPMRADATEIPNRRNIDQMRNNLESRHGPANNWYALAPPQARQFARDWLGNVIKLKNENLDTSKALQSLKTIWNQGPLRGVKHEQTFVLPGPATHGRAVSVTYRSALFMSLTRVLASVTWTGAQTGAPDALNLRTATGMTTMAAGKNIAALLVHGTRIIGWGVNTNDDNGTRHAETNAIQSYQQGIGTPLPMGVELFTTLQPCFMCAGLYAHAGGAACTYDQTDPGMVAGTALAATAQPYVDNYAATRSFGQVLTEQNALTGGRAPDFLRTIHAARHYANALQRFTVMGMGARSPDERLLWQECLAFLKRGPLAPIMNRPDLFLID